MKSLVFKKNKDGYEVRIYRSGDEHVWTKYGGLLLNDKGRWSLHPAKGVKIEKTYYKDLVKTYDALERDLLEILQN